MKIVILDGHTLNPGDLDWKGLEALGTCTFHKRLPPAEVAARAQGAEVLITNKALIDAAAIDALPDLRYIGVTATGTNIVDVEAARARGIIVTNAPAYNGTATAQGVFALLLELTNHAGHHSRTVHDGRWSASEDFCYWDKPLLELEGMTMGIIGFGTIGQAVAQRAKAFGMRVIVHTRTPQEAEDIAFLPLDEVLGQADVLSLHCPLTEETERLINAGTLARMKPTALFLNAARGGLVDETALAAALNEGRLAGAGLDTLSTEPPSPDNPLLSAANCVITPHNSWATRPARQRLMDITVANLSAWLDGAPVNVVS